MRNYANDVQFGGITAYLTFTLVSLPEKVTGHSYKTYSTVFRYLENAERKEIALRQRRLHTRALLMNRSF
jgi:hypothetical protein